MAVFLTPFIADLRARTLAIWPETATSGIWLADDIDTVPWESLGDTYAVMLVSKAVKSDNYQGANIVFTLPIEMYYVSKYAGDMTGTIPGGTEALIDKAEDWTIAMVRDTLTVGQLLSIDEIDWGKDIPANGIMKAKNMTHRAVRVSCTVLLGFNPRN